MNRKEIPTLYDMAIQTLVCAKSFEISKLDGLPGFIKEDMLRQALLRGQALTCVSCFLHPNITHLCINSAHISPCDLKNISGCREIKTLKMNPPTLQRFAHSAKVLKTLFPKLTHLVKLHIQRNDGMTNNAMLSLARHCRSLQQLDVTNCRKLTNRGFCYLSTLPSLREINLSQTLVGDLGILALAHGACAGTLASITLNSCSLVTDDGLKPLIFRCNRLSLLVCGGCPKICGKILRFLGARRMIRERVCCPLPGTNVLPCHHFGNCVLKLHSNLLIVL